MNVQVKLGGIQAPTNLAQADPIEADPGEHQPDQARFLLDHLDPRHPATLILGHVAVAEGRPPQGTREAGTRGMATSAPASLQELGAFVLGDHALHLQQEIVFRAGADGTVHEDHFGARPAEFLNEKHLVSVAPRQAIRSMDVDPIDHAGGDRVAQPLQSGTPQRCAAVAVIDEHLPGVEGQSVGGNALAHGRHLTGDGVAAGLLVTRHASIQGNLGFRHDQLSALSVRRRSGSGPEAAPGVAEDTGA